MPPGRHVTAADFDHAAFEAFGLDRVHACEGLAQRFRDLAAVADDVAAYGEARIATRRIERDQLIASTAGDRIDRCYWHLLADDDFERVAEAEVAAQDASLDDERRELLALPERHERVARARATLEAAARDRWLVRATMRSAGATNAQRPRSATGTRPRRRRTTARRSSSRGSPDREPEPDAARDNASPGPGSDA